VSISGVRLAAAPPGVARNARHAAKVEGNDRRGQDGFEKVINITKEGTAMQLLNKAEEAAADILKAFENPNSLPKPLANVFVRRNDGALCRKWSWRNQLIVALRGHKEARGFRQWEEVGRRVRKGATAFRILSPLAKKVVEDGTNEERVAVFGFRGTPVFGLGQTEGEPLAEAEGELDEWLDTLPLRDVAKAWGLSVEGYNGQPGGYLGVYKPRSGIALGVKNLSTWCHELVHAADDRNGTMTKNKVKREVVAELGGAVLLTLLGYEHEADLGGCWDYVRRYAGDEKIEVLSACGKVLDRTCGAVALILDTAEQLQVAQGQGAVVENSKPSARRSRASDSTTTQSRRTRR
jgi:hypothetical protein